MSVAYKGGVDYIRSYSGVLKILEGSLHVTLIVFAMLLGTSFQAQFFCGISIYGFVSTIVLVALHIRGIIKNYEFPWFLVECINCGIMGLLKLISSTLVVMVLTRGYILTGILGYITVLVYSLDTIEQFHLARTPRARYVWTTPNMPV